MVDIVPPFSMPSAIASSQYMLDPPLPSLSQGRNTAKRWDRDTSTDAHTVRGPEQNALSQHLQGSVAKTRHGLKTPPEDMSASNANPLLVPFHGLQYKSVPVLGSSNASYQADQGTHVNTRYTHKSQPFYDSYHSAQQRQSPVLRGESIGSRHQLARRRASSDGNSIVSYLQIPPSINNSKGSLAEFAAQVRSSTRILVQQD